MPDVTTNVPMPISRGDFGLRRPHHRDFFLTNLAQFDKLMPPEFGVLVPQLRNATSGTSEPELFGTSSKTTHRRRTKWRSTFSTYIIFLVILLQPQAPTKRAHVSRQVNILQLATVFLTKSRSIYRRQDHLLKRIRRCLQLTTTTSSNAHTHSWTWW